MSRVSFRVNPHSIRKQRYVLQICSACVCSALLCGRATLTVNEKNVIRLDFWIYVKGLRARLSLTSMRESLQNKKQGWFGHLERMKESAWSSK